MSLIPHPSGSAFAHVATAGVALAGLLVPSASHAVPAEPAAGGSCPLRVATTNVNWGLPPAQVDQVGLDSNTDTHARLERRTGLRRHGVGYDGFLTDLRLDDVHALPRGHSDHHPTVANLTGVAGTACGGRSTQGV